MAKKQTLVEELQDRIDTLIKKSAEADELRGSIIKLQEDLIGELIEELSREKQRGLVSFKAGAFAGLVLGTIICMIINLVITVIR